MMHWEYKITSLEDVQKRRRELETLPEDWYIDHDGSYASLPTADAIEKVCAAAERALLLGLRVDELDPDANGGTCIDILNADEARVSIYFSNGGGASAHADHHGPRGQGGWHEAFTEATWARIKEFLKS